MRDPARIPRILEAIRVEWEKSPDLRLGQLLRNAGRGDSDDFARWFFYIEDDRLIEAVRALKLKAAAAPRKHHALDELLAEHAADELTAEAERLGLYGDPPKQPKG